ncbi:hypothetical protein HYALB_00009318 [Hymenoscyphus albidus]|uniref:Uncharacterized protein n=1 Tax=Hymenoscyphus albidus TaxID=595503 RepID=A0A9N9LRT8_9HELO|nr:hypothetical protein HYALB_00009318 [Hymenoscyphus albidus]
MTDLVREAPLGQAIRWITGNRLLQYPEERPGFELPTQYLTKFNSEKRRQSILSPVNMKTSGPNLQRNDTTTTSSGDSDLEGLGISKTKSRMDTQPYSSE